RHTRLQGDWSSDVCSSDLVAGDPAGVLAVAGIAAAARALADQLHLLLAEALVTLKVHAAQLCEALEWVIGARLGAVAVGPLVVRSEERRVGKEWRCRWWGR